MEQKQTFLALYYHFVWTTKGRARLIDKVVARHLQRYISLKCAELNAKVYAIGGVADHIHLACSLPTTISIADFMHRVKGASSHSVNEMDARNERFEWQRGYGALTFSPSDLQQIIAYVKNQAAHHSHGQTWDELEQVEEQPASACFLQT